MLTEILPKTAEFFMLNGIKSPNMDDICKHLRISKKTLYQFVKNKSDLVCKSMAWMLEKETIEILAIESGPGNAIDKIYLINKLVYYKLKNIQPAVLYDLQRHFPEAWDLFTKHKAEFITKVIQRNLLQGIDEHLFRSNMNIEIVAHINVMLINEMLESKILPPDKYSFVQIHNEITKYHLGGICNSEGLQYLHHLLHKKTK